jgi:hypothetical protein
MGLAEQSQASPPSDLSDKSESPAKPRSRDAFVQRPPERIALENMERLHPMWPNPIVPAVTPARSRVDIVAKRAAH